MLIASDIVDYFLVILKPFLDILFVLCTVWRILSILLNYVG